MGERFKTVTPVRRIKKSNSSSVSKDEFIGLMMERERLEYMLHSINSTAETLLGAIDDSNFETSLLTGMQLIAYSVDVERVHIWKNEMREGGLFYELRYGWNADSNDGASPTRYVSYNYHTDNPVWEEKLKNGEYVNGPVNSLSLLEQSILFKHRIMSILVLPVFLEQHFWGFVSFDDLKQERTFNRDEINILYTYSLMMISALNRSLQTVKLNKAYNYSQLMLDATPLSCRIWDREMNMLDCNNAAVRLFEMGDKEEYIRRFRECYPMYQPSGVLSTDKIRSMLTVAFRDGQHHDMFMHQLPNGEKLPTEVHLIRVEADNGYIVASYSRDMREHLKMMEEIEHRDVLLNTAKDVATVLLQAEPETFETDLVECLAMMTKAANADRSYIWQNISSEPGGYAGRQLYEWSGRGFNISTEDLSGKPYMEYFPELETYLVKGEFINGPKRDFDKKTQELMSRLGIRSTLIIPVFLDNRLWGFVGFDDAHKVRSFSENEESILHSGCLLITNALQRNNMTQDLKDSAVRLEVALKDAQAASQAKSNFLSNMSHEIRTPINAITGMTSIGKSSANIERKDYAFKKIEDASKHLLGVINDILDMSKIEAEKFELSLIGFNFTKMLQKVVDVNRFRLDEKHQRLVIDIDEKIPAELYGDDQRLSQVVSNLLSNAIKFTGEGKSIKITSMVLEETEEVCKIRVSVADSGIGISGEQKKRLFASFSQAENDTSRKFGGTGLGLAISKRIIDLMGGRIWVDSVLGEGSAFSFEVALPHVKGAADSGDSYGEVAITENIFKGVKMLLAEDMDINREIVVAMMESTGIEMDFAANGREAVEKVNAAPDKYGIIFMDIQMPEMDGLEATRQIRKLPAERAKTVPIVAMSANVFREDVEKCLVAGMNGHVGKPLDFTEVFEKINHYTSDVNRG